MLPRILNMSTGPVHVSDAVLRAQLDANTSSHSTGFLKLYDSTVAATRALLRTTAETLVVHGSIRTGLDLALGNLIAPGDKILALTNGFWGEYLAASARRHGGNVIPVACSILHPIDVEFVRQALSEHPDIKLVTLVHVETNTGVENPVQDIGRLVASSGAVLLVDTACSAGSIPLETDLWGVDVGVTGSHKGLGALPGLTVLTVSEKAWGKFGQMATRTPQSPWNLRALFDAALTRGAPPLYTQPTSLVQALAASLHEIDGCGADRWFEAHARAAESLRSALRAEGFRLATDASRTPDQGLDYGLSPSVVAVLYPEGLNDSQFRTLLEHEYGIFVIGNVGEQAGRSFRVGLMSSVQIDPRSIMSTVAAIVAVSGQLGFKRTSARCRSAIRLSDCHDDR